VGNLQPATRLLDKPESAHRRPERLSYRPERLSCRPERPLSSRACEGPAFPRGRADQPRSSRRPHGRLGAALFVATRTVRASCPCVPPGISCRALAGWVGGLGIAAGQGRRELSAIGYSYQLSARVSATRLPDKPESSRRRPERLSCRPERLLSSRACEGSALPRDNNRSLRSGETASSSELVRSPARRCRSLARSG
jgi:hypothetical protein